MKSLSPLIISLLAASCCCAQTGDMWTWVSGDSTTDNAAVYGTRGIGSILNKPGARSYGVSWIDASGNLWLFGGIGQTGTTYGTLNDLWKYNTATKEWTWVKGDSTIKNPGVYGTKGIASPANNPASRTYAVSWIDTAGNLWLFGGAATSLTASGYLNDLWKYTPSTNQWTWVSGDSTFSSPGIYGIKGIPSAANKPGARGSAISWADETGNLWLFSGYNIPGPYNDVWRYNIATNRWTWMNGDSVKSTKGMYGIRGASSPGNTPGARRLGVGWRDLAGNFWTFGGIGFDGKNHEGKLNDLWKYDHSINEWTWIKGDTTRDKIGKYGTQGVPSASNKPGSRYLSAAWADASGNFWLFGGPGYDETGSFLFLLNDLWKFIPSTNQWVWMKGGKTIGNSGVYGTIDMPSPSNTPGAREVNCSWTDRAGNLWLFGGYGQTISKRGHINDLWKYSAGIAFPLQLITFTGGLQDNTAHLQWTSENEQNFSHYEVERSGDSRKFSKVGSVKSKGENGRSEYRFDDLVSGSKINYRLKMLDNDGSYKYSNVVQLTRDSKPQITIYPNPAKDHITIQLPTFNVQHPTVVEISDVTGKVVLRRQSSEVGGPINLSTNKLLNGTYTVNMRVGEAVFGHKLIIKK